MLQEYQSRPVTRRAHKITELDTVSKVPGVEATYVLEAEDQLKLIFKAYEPCAVGDYIVYLTAEDIYHCSAKVFAERNIVPD